MNSRRFLHGTAAVAALLAAPSDAAEPAPSVAVYEAAMRDLDYRRAAREADALASRHRLAQRDARPDPVLTGLFGRVYMRRGEPATALPYLRHSDSPSVPAPQRIAAGFARAEAEEAMGEWTAAGATFDRLLLLPLDRVQQIEARTGLARVRLADDPAAALAAARTLAAEAPAAQRWEAELVSAQALSLLGRANQAEEAASRAWDDSVEAGTAQAAPMRVALVRAGLAAAAGRREPLIAMLSAANASLNAIESAIAGAAPLCGEGGLLPADHATFAAFTRTDSTQWLAPIAASRPAAAALFRKAIAGQRLLAGTGTSPGGLVFTLRCRTESSADYAPPLTEQPWTRWFADRGLYFVLAADTELDGINRVASEIDTLVARQGEEHSAVIPLRVSLVDMLERRASTAPDVSGPQVAELRRKVVAALTKAGGAESFLPDPEAETERLRLEQAGSVDEAIAVFRAGHERAIGRMPPRLAYSAFREWGRHDKDLPEPTRRRIIESLLARMDGGPSDPIRRALQRRLGSILKEAGERAAARAVFAAAGLAKDSCGIMEKTPEQKEHGMTDDDYPADVLDPNLAGVTTVELDLGTDGRVVSSRTILAAPSRLFDTVLDSKIPRFRYTPATDQGRPRACRGLNQTIKWRMPEEESAGPPLFLPLPEGT